MSRPDNQLAGIEVWNGFDKGPIQKQESWVAFVEDDCQLSAKEKASKSSEQDANKLLYNQLKIFDFSKTLMD